MIKQLKRAVQSSRTLIMQKRKENIHSGALICILSATCSLKAGSHWRRILQRTLQRTLQQILQRTLQRTRQQILQQILQRMDYNAPHLSYNAAL